MKKIICTILAVLTIIGLSGCNNNPGNTKSPTDNSIDIDLTKLSSTMVYSEVYNMMTTPSTYMGKIIKMNGMFSVYHDEVTGKYYFACIIADATACCSQGLEFELVGEHKYPEDYPKIGTEITVTGEFSTYMEGKRMYCYLINATME